MLHRMSVKVGDVLAKEDYQKGEKWRVSIVK